VSAPVSRGGAPGRGLCPAVPTGRLSTGRADRGTGERRPAEGEHEQTGEREESRRDVHRQLPSGRV